MKLNQIVKNGLKLTPVAILSLSFSSHGADFSVADLDSVLEADHHGRHHGRAGHHGRGLRQRAKRVCSKVGFTKEQLKEIRTKHQAFRKDYQKEIAELQKARQSYRQSLVQESSSRGGAEAANRVLVDKRKVVADARTELRHTVNFDVLEAKQRGPALKCFNLLRQLKKQQRQGKPPRKPKPPRRRRS